MVDYPIDLPRVVSGREMLFALRSGIKELKWHYNDKAEKTSDSYYSVNTRITEKTAGIRTSFLGQSAKIYNVTLDGSYATLELSSSYFSAENLEKLASVLNRILEETKPAQFLNQTHIS